MSPWRTVTRGCVLVELPPASSWSARTLEIRARPGTPAALLSYVHRAAAHLPKNTTRWLYQSTHRMSKIQCSGADVKQCSRVTPHCLPLEQNGCYVQTMKRGSVLLISIALLTSDRSPIVVPIFMLQNDMLIARNTDHVLFYKM